MTVAGGKAPYTWKSSNEAIAKVDANGTVTAVSGGNATITVTDADGTTAECVVRVKGAASGRTMVTVVYNGESYFADEVFFLTEEQKALAAEYARNLTLFLSDIST